MSFIAELKRRNVFRVGAAYAIVGWLLVEVASVVLPTFEAPDWVMQAFTFLVILGFPLALIFAWAFELTPEGIKRETAVDPAESISRATGRKLDFAIIGLLGIAVVYFAVDKFALQGEQRPVPPGEIASIAVLPLQNLLNDPQQDYFVQGMHEALITELSKIRALKVISRTSAMRYRNAEKSVPEIAHELGVDAVVEGSVLRAGNTVRITAQLIEARNDRHLWADSFDRELSDILALHSDLAQAIAGEIRVAVTPEEESRLAESGSVDPEVYELYLKGRYLCGKWTRAEMASGIRYLQQAIERDPGYAPGHAELAACYTDTAFFEYLPPLEVHPLAKAAAFRAVEIDDRLAEAHTALGAFYYQMEWKFRDSENAFKRAIELNPSSSRALVYYAFMLGETGRFEEAMVQARRVQALDLLSVLANVAVAEIHYLSRNYDEAIEEYSKNLDLSPNDPGVYYFLAWPYEQKGMFEKAIAMLEKAVTLSEGAPVHLAALGHANALAGRRGEALKILERLQDPTAPMPPSPFHIALVHIGLGNDDSAFQWLEEALRQRALQLIYLKAGPKFDRLRSDPRFDDLLRRLNLLDR